MALTHPAHPTPARAPPPKPPHGTFRTRRGRARRPVCTICGRTRSARAGTPYHRTRRPAKDLDLALTMSTHGMTATAIARTLRAHPSTIRRCLEKAGAHVKTFSEEKLLAPDAAEFQLDELRVGGIRQAEGTWAWSAIEVNSRAWLATKVSRRTLRATRPGGGGSQFSSMDAFESVIANRLRREGWWVVPSLRIWNIQCK